MNQKICRIARIGLLSLFASSLALAGESHIKVFKAVKEVEDFLKANPAVRVVAVTPITSSTTSYSVPMSAQVISSVYTSALVVTYEQN